MSRTIHSLLFLFVIPIFGFAQTHDWALGLNVISGRAQINAQVVDDSSNVYIAGSFYGVLNLATDTFSFSSTSNQTIFLAKYDKDGNYKWGKAFTSATSANIIDMVINSQNQIILFGHGGGTLSFGSTTFTRSSYVFVAFMTPAGSFTSAKELAYGFYTNGRHIALGKNDEIYVSMYLNGYGSTWKVVNGSGTKTGSGYVNTISKFNATATSLSWSIEYDITDIGTIHDLAVDKDNQAYFCGNIAPNKTILGSTTSASSRTSYLVWLGSDGSYKNKLITSSINFKGSNLSRIEVIDSTLIYIAGNSFNDSMGIGSKMIYSLSADPNKSFYFVAELVDFDSISWYRSTSHRPQVFSGGGSMDFNFKISGDFLFLSIYQNSNGFSFGGLSTSASVPAIVSKLDRLGNVLWYLPIAASSFPTLSSIGQQDLLYSGAFSGTITLSPFSLSNPASASYPKPFIARTADYSITRGAVNAGPYCAGDTLFVPYQSSGEYDTSNVFIAELSDENGEFFGNQFELGRLKTNEDSTVIGVLPLFQVASSNRYRIRIRSTAPTVQSYYQLDTLNLLIYSRDKADPGKDTSLCYGDTLKLNNFGGTRWQWTPNYAISDSTVRNPFVFPLQDTTYTLIISDSSGCGAPDTADIKISIIQPPYFATLTQSDTVVCIGDSVDLSIEALAGIGQYYINWMSPQGALLKTTNTISKDTFRLKIDSNTIVYALVTDSCSTRIDTATFLIYTYSATQIINQPIDTQVCYGQEIILSNYLQHPKLDSITWAWYQVGSNAIVGTDSFLKKSFSNNVAYRVVAKNACTQEEITHSFNVSVFSPLSAAIVTTAASDSFCVGTNQILYATPSGGSPNFPKWSKWIFGNEIIDSDSILLNFDSLYSLNPLQRNYDIKLVTSDGCTSPNDTASYNFYLYPKLSIDTISLPDSVLCLGRSMSLISTIYGGKGEDYYAYEWWYLGNRVGGDSAVFKVNSNEFTAGQLHTLQAKVTDGCSEPDSVNVTFRIPDSLNTAIVFPFAEAEICNGKGQLFKSSSSGGIPQDYAYVWTINGKQVSDTDSFLFGGVEHRLTVDSIFQVTLSLADNCNLPIALDSVLIKIKPIPLLSLTGDSLYRNQRNDTTICRGNNVQLTPKIFYNSNSVSDIKWFVNGVYAQTSTDFTFSTDMQLDSVSQYRISYALGDSCATSQDTNSYIITLRDKLTLNGIQDTTVCHGSQIDLVAISTGGLASDHKVEWTSLTNNALLGEGENFSIFNLLADQQIIVTLTDGCTVLSDSFLLRISVLPRLDLALSESSNCSDAPILLTAVGSGGITGAYNFRWFLNGNLLSNTLNTLSVTPSKLENYKVVFSDNCSQPAVFDSVFVSPSPRFTVLNVEKEICEKYVPSWQFKSDNGDDYNYSVVVRNTSALVDLDATPSYSAGEYNWVVTSQNSLGCRDSQIISTLVKPLPDARFTWSPDYPSFEQPEVTFLAQSDNDFYSWYLGDELVNDSKAYTTAFNALGFYKVRLSVETNGCSDSFTKSIEFIDTYKWLEVTSFSPNGDGLNDVYKPYLTGISEVNFEIYNRWGQLVFQGNSINSSWDGTYLGNAVPNGVYYVLLSVQDTKKQNHYYRSSVRLVK